MVKDGVDFLQVFANPASLILDVLSVLLERGADCRRVCSTFFHFAALFLPFHQVVRHKLAALGESCTLLFYLVASFLKLL
jgi:hypothetical protein